MTNTNITKMQLADIAEQGAYRPDGAIGIQEVKYDADILACFEEAKLIKHLVGSAYMIPPEVVGRYGLAAYVKSK